MCSEQIACVIVTRAGMYQHARMLSLVGCTATYGHGSSSENSLVLLCHCACLDAVAVCSSDQFSPLHIIYHIIPKQLMLLNLKKI